MLEGHSLHTKITAIADFHASSLTLITPVGSSIEIIFSLLSLYFPRVLTSKEYLHEKLLS